MADLTLGPLAFLEGTWEGSKGINIAPDENREVEEESYRESITFERILPVDNHDQWLYGLRYNKTVWEEGADEPFHEEVGYWLYEPATRQIIKSFSIPRGMIVQAGGKAQPKDKEFTLIAELGSQTFGIVSNPYLDQEFQTVKYTTIIKQLDDGSFHYHEDTELKIKGRVEIFHHTDENTLQKI